MNIRDLTKPDMDALGTAAIVGTAPLAWELERLGLSDMETSLRDAEIMRDTLVSTADSGREKPRVLQQMADSARKELFGRRWKSLHEEGEDASI